MCLFLENVREFFGGVRELNVSLPLGWVEDCLVGGASQLKEALLIVRLDVSGRHFLQTNLPHKTLFPIAKLSRAT